MKKKAILKNFVFALVLLTSIYIYFAEMVVLKNATRENLNQMLARTSIFSAKLESAFIAESGKKTLDYFIAAGYEQPKNLEVIEKASNVAANY